MGSAKGDSAKPSTTLLVDWKPTVAFMVKGQLAREEQKINVSCILDTGSPISLINYCLVKHFSYHYLNYDFNHFEGINQTKLEILGILNFMFTVLNLN